MAGWEPIESGAYDVSILRNRSGGRQRRGNLKFWGDCTPTGRSEGNRIVRKGHPPEVLEREDSCGEGRGCMRVEELKIVG
jgi:hypothetical protein